MPCAKGDRQETASCFYIMGFQFQKDLITDAGADVTGESLSHWAPIPALFVCSKSKFRIV